jgi:hypothetical protein
MITSFDDYPLHAGSRPVNETATNDINHYDRYFFNGYTKDASLYFGVAMGLYPNRHVVDAAFSVVVGGNEQISVHSSGRAPDDRAATTHVGPIRIEILEPMRRHRLTVDTPEHGLRAELEFTARSAALQEPHFLLKAGNRTVFDYTRLTQFGRWSGWIEVDGARRVIDESFTFGSRDRSWGTRPVGPSADVGAPVGDRQFYWLWAPVSFDDFATHFDVNEHASGSRWHQTGFFIHDGNSSPEEHDDVDYSIEWRRGTRWANRFSIDLRGSNSESHHIELEPLYEFQMIGLGYGHPEWGHGFWKGESAVGGERWNLPVTNPLDPKHLHIQAVCRATCDGHVGIGILEQLVVGPHEPSGLAELLDGAR